MYPNSQLEIKALEENIPAVLYPSLNIPSIHKIISLKRWGVLHPCINYFLTQSLILFSAYPVQVCGRPGAYPKELRAKGSVYSGWGSSLSQGKQAHTFSHCGEFENANYCTLICMTSGCGRKSVYPVETYRAQEEHANSIHTDLKAQEMWGLPLSPATHSHSFWTAKKAKVLISETCVAQSDTYLWRGLIDDYF